MIGRERDGRSTRLSLGKTMKYWVDRPKELQVVV
jgi:hypothetical protein